MALLKKGICEEIVLLNYAKTYSLQEKKLIKKEKKLISLRVQDGEVEKLIACIEQVSGRKRENGDLIMR